MEIFLFLAVIAVLLFGHIVNNSAPKKPYKKYKRTSQEQNQNLERGNNQLVMVNKGGYTSQRLLNQDEITIYRIIQKAIAGKSMYCFLQVSCGEFLSHKDRLQFNATVNSKRVDFCICNSYFHPIAVIEYQGSGHQLSGDSGIRDSVKRIASENAGLKFIQIFKGENWNEKISLELNQLRQ